MLDIDGSLREIEYALDALHADGINLMTNIGDKWLGDPYYDPVFEELHRRKAVVYTHPIAPTCLHDVLPGVNDSIVEFGSDTTRAIARLLFSGAAARFHDIRFIFSHAGGTMPFLVERFERAPGRYAPKVAGGTIAHLKRFYYDTAQAAHPWALMGLTRLVAISQNSVRHRFSLPHRRRDGARDCGIRLLAERSERDRLRQRAALVAALAVNREAAYFGGFSSFQGSLTLGMVSISTLASLPFCISVLRI